MYTVIAKLYDFKNVEVYSNVEHFNEYKYNDALKNFNRQFKKIKMLCKNLFKLLTIENDQKYFTLSIKLYSDDGLLKEYNGKWQSCMFNNNKRTMKCTFTEYVLRDNEWVEIDSYISEYNY